LHTFDCASCTVKARSDEIRILSRRRTDEEILESVRNLAQREGVFAEPGGAAAIPAIKKLRDSGAVGELDKVVCLVTGHGLKDPSAAVGGVRVETIDPEREAAPKAVNSV
jgi:threonine synthase